jgi:hypothetical protein
MKIALPSLLVPSLCLAASGCAQTPAAAADPPLPEGWRLAYEQHFDSAGSLRGFAMTDPAAWQFASDGRSFALALVQQSKFEPAVRSPVNIALIKDHQFGDFVLEASLTQTGREYGHRDMCIFFGVQDPTHFYYVHLATAADDHAHNVFIVNDQPRSKIALRTTKGVNWGLEVWHRVRLERRLAEGTIKVFFDDFNEPVMVASDKTFAAGWIGFGSFDDTGKIDDIRVWTPEEPISRSVTFYHRLEP